jgi:mRNA-degrading endonuclease RelE of RelBE toxin-antitoxin system
VRVTWSPRAITTAARFLRDQDGMRAIGAAVAALAGEPYPPESFRWGRYQRLHVGPYRIMYAVDTDAELITVDRVDRITTS